MKSQKYLFPATNFLLIVASIFLISCSPKVKKSKSIEVIQAQLISKNDGDEFTIRKDKFSDLTMVYVEQKNIGLGASSDSEFSFVVDCFFKGKELTETPNRFGITIHSTSKDWKFVNLRQFDVNADNELFTLQEKDRDGTTDSGWVFESVTYLLSRNQLEKMANSKETAIRIGIYEGELNKAQKISIRQLLDATSVD